MTQTMRSPGAGAGAGPAVAYAAFGYGWAMVFFNYPSAWSSLSTFPAAETIPATGAFFVAACVSMFACSFIGDGLLGVAAVLAGLMASGSAIAMAAWPGTIPLGAIAVAMGAAAGLTYAIGLLFLVHRAPAPFDPRIVGVCIASFSAVSGVLLALLRIRGAAVALAVALPLCSAAAGLRVRRSVEREPIEERGLPVRPALGLVYLIALNYIAYNAATVTSIYGSAGFIAGKPALDWAFRAFVAIAAVATIRRFNVVKMLYGSYIMIMAALAFSVMGPRGRLPYGLLINTAFVLTEFGYASLLVRLGRGSKARPALFALGTLVVALPSLVGNHLGAWLSPRLGEASLLTIGAGLALYCVALPFVPGLLRSIEGAFAATPAGGDDGQESFIRETFFSRLPAERSLDAIESSYDDDYRLSPREREVAALLLDRYDYDAIAARLGISLNTVKSHARSIYRKYDIRGRKDLIALSANATNG
ncbi:MAG TPA: helix-turn-helix transcriptional regulator [Spirochaetales bacterium]|nr:helix-turn-helix transcriptional regulator [Spirochaetales bacterium]